MFFSVFFGLFGEKSVSLQWFCSMLIINDCFRFCDMCETSGANALIVSQSRFRGGEMISRIGIQGIS